MKILQNEITRTPISFSINFGGKLSEFHPLVPFSWAPASTAVYIYFHCSFLYNTIISLEPCAIKCYYTIKFPYFVDTTEIGDRGWEQALRQAEVQNEGN
jgi:hypothetical protein